MGQVVRLIRVAAREGAAQALVELPDGRREQIPLTWTDLPTTGGTAMPALLFSPGSLRALVRLVRSLGMPPCAEADHANASETDDLDHAAGRGAQPMAALWADLLRRHLGHRRAAREGGAP